MIPHTQNQPTAATSDSKAADYWDLHTDRAMPEYVGKHRAEQTIIKADKLRWWEYAIAILGTAAAVAALVILYSYAPLVGV